MTIPLDSSKIDWLWLSAIQVKRWKFLSHLNLSFTLIFMNVLISLSCEVITEINHNFYIVHVCIQVSTWWVRLILLSQQRLFSNQQCCQLLNLNNTRVYFKRFWECLELNFGPLGGRESKLSMLSTVVFNCVYIKHGQFFCKTSKWGDIQDKTRPSEAEMREDQGTAFFWQDL